MGQIAGGLLRRCPVGAARLLLALAGAALLSACFEDIPLDEQAPGTVSAFSAAAGDAQVALTWVNPTDKDFAGVKICRGTTGYPGDDRNCGAVYDGTASTFTNIGLANGIPYFYTAFAYDQTHNYASGAQASAIPTAADTTAPTVTGTTPADAASGVAISSTVSVTFSEVMNLAATEAAFSISPATSGAFTWSGSGTVLTFTPSSSLAYDTTYTVTVGTGATDAAGNPLASAYNFDFTTTAAPDTTAPTVVGTSPSDGATGVAVTSTISVTFSEGMDATATQPAFGTSPAVSGAFAWNTGNTVLTFTPASSLAYSTTYTVTVGTGATDAAGNPLASAYSFSFTTAAVTGSVPGAPGNLIATAGNFVVDLLWSAPTTGGVPDGYEVFRAAASPVDTSGASYAAILASSTSYQDLAVANGTTYYYRAVAYNGAGNGPDSNENDATPHVQSGGTWVTRAPMPTAREIFATAVVNGVIYAIGGINASGNLATVEAYDPVSNTWATKTPMPTAREDLATAVVNGVIYAIGGFNPSGWLATVEAYDPVSNTWSPKAGMSAARGRLTAAEVNGVIYAIGGANGGLVATVEAYDPVSNTWTSKTSMPTARQQPTAEMVNGVIYAIGGSGISGFLATVEAYDPVSNTWTTQAAMPTARAGFTGAEVNGVIYAIGGNNGAALATVEAYDPVSNTWTTQAAMPTARYYLTGAEANGLIYAIGGFNNGTLLNTVEEYTPPPLQPENGWVTKAPMPTARSQPVSEQVNGKIYVIGGNDGPSYFSIVEEYDPATNSWMPRAPMPTARTEASSSEVNGRIYVIGGGTDVSRFNIVEEYEPASNSWTNCGNPAPNNGCAAMTSARNDHSTSVVNGKIYVIGGSGGDPLDTVEEYDPATNTWTNCGTPAPGNGCEPMPTARSGLTSGAINGKIYAIGGSDGASFLSIVEEYDPATNTWSNCSGSCATMPTARNQVRSSVVNGKIYVIGGHDSAGNRSTVYEYDPVTNTWSTKAPMPTARTQLAAAAVNGRIYAIGGYDGTSYFTAVEAYTPPGAQPSPPFWTAVTASEHHTVALKSDGTLWAWGRSDSGQLGLGNSTGPETCGTIPCSTVPMRVGADTDWVAVAAGGMYSLALKSNGTLWAWGANWSGQLGLGTTGPETCTYGSLACRATPVQVGTDADWVAVATGWMHSLALKSNGTLWAWGSNDIGELGQGTESGPETCTFSGKSQACSTTPLQVGADVDWAIVDAAGSSHSMAIKTSGTLWAWGYNARSELGFASSGTCSWPAQNEDSPCTKSPTQVGTDTNWAEVVAANGDHTHAVKTTGTLWAWGNNNYGQLGLGTNTGPENCGPYGTACSTIPRQVGADTGWSGIAAGGGLSIARKIDGTLWAAGADYLGQLGTTTTETCDSPGDPSVPCSTILIQVDVDADWAAVAVGSAHSLALRTDGTLWAWGGNSLGQLGLGDTANRDVPTQVVVP